MVTRRNGSTITIANLDGKQSTEKDWDVHGMTYSRSRRSLALAEIDSLGVTVSSRRAMDVGTPNVSARNGKQAASKFVFMRRCIYILCLTTTNVIENTCNTL